MGKSKKSTKKTKKEGKLDFAVNGLKEGFDFFSKKWKPASVDFLKVYLLTIVIFAIGALVVAPVWFLTFDITLTAIVGGIVFLLVTIILGIFQTTFYNIVDKISKNKRASLTESFSENAMAWVKYAVFWLAVILILAAPTILIYATSLFNLFSGVDDISSNPQALLQSLGSFFLGLVFIILAFLVIYVLQFLFGFLEFELFISKLGLRQSLKKSYELIKNNFWETFLFTLGRTIILGVISFAIQLPLQIISRLIGFFGTLSTDLLLTVVLLVVIYLVFGILMVLLAALQLMLDYKFWKKVRG